MKKLRGYVDKWITGGKVNGFDLSRYDIDQCIMVYNDLSQYGRAMFVNGNVKKVLEDCGISCKVNGIGWKAYVKVGN